MRYQEIIIAISDINDWDKADNFMKAIESIGIGMKVVIDFTNIDIVKPSGLMMLILLTHTIYSKTKTTVGIRNVDSNIYTYMDKNNFFRDLPLTVEQESIKWDIYKKREQYSPIVELTRIDSGKLRKQTRLQIREALKIWFSEEKFKEHIGSIETIFMELCNNSLEHSTGTEEMGSCYFMLQKYVRRNFIEISLVIGDTGIGIKKHIQKKHGELYSNDTDYLYAALQNGFSGRDDGSGGFGLQKIKDNIARFNGDITIKSLKGFITMGINSSRTEDKNCKFDTIGTQIEIILRNEYKYIDKYYM